MSLMMMITCSLIVNSAEMEVSAVVVSLVGSAAAVLAVNGRERIADDVAKSVHKQSGTFVFWIKTIEWRSGRNRHEASVLAQGLDHMVEEGIVPSESNAMETFIRRLIGIHEVDQSRDWAVAKALAWEEHGSILPRSALRLALREAAIESKLQAAPAKPKWSGRGSGSTNSNNNNNNGYNFNGGRGQRGGRGRGHNQSQRGGAQSISPAGPAATK